MSIKPPAVVMTARRPDGRSRTFTLGDGWNWRDYDDAMTRAWEFAQSGAVGGRAVVLVYHLARHRERNRPSEACGMSARTIEVAPADCVVCGKKHPGGDDVPGWTYLAGAEPIGSLACSATCVVVAVERHHNGQRVDGKGPR